MRIYRFRGVLWKVSEKFLNNKLFLSLFFLVWNCMAETFPIVKALDSRWLSSLASRTSFTLTLCAFLAPCHKSHPECHVESDQRWLDDAGGGRRPHPFIHRSVHLSTQQIFSFHFTYFKIFFIKKNERKTLNWFWLMKFLSQTPFHGASRIKV